MRRSRTNPSFPRRNRTRAVAPPIAGNVTQTPPGSTAVPGWVNESQSQHVGMLKERRDFFIKMYKKQYSDRLQAFTMKFVDQAMNIFVIFGDLPGLDLEDCVLLKGTIRRHQDNHANGAHETVLNRCKLLKNVGSQTNPKDISYADVPDETEDEKPDESEED